MVSTFDRNYSLLNNNDKDGYHDPSKHDYDPRGPPSPLITPTKESSSPSSSTEPTSMPSDKSSSRVPSEDKMDVTSLEMTELDQSKSDISLSPTRERRVEGNYANQSVVFPGDNKANCDYFDYGGSYCQGEYSNDLSYYNQTRKNGTLYPPNVYNNNRGYSNNFYGNRSYYGQPSNQPFDYPRQQPMATPRYFPEMQSKFASSMQSRKRISPTPNSTLTPKGSKRKKADLSQAPKVPQSYEFDPRSLLDDPKVLLVSPQVQTLSDILPPDPKPKFINPDTETGLPTRLLRTHIINDSTVQDYWAQKYQSFSFDIRLLDSLTYDKLSRELGQDFERITSAELILYDHLFNYKSKKYPMATRKKLDNNFLKKSRDNCIIRVSSNAESDYLIPPSPDDTPVQNPEPCDYTGTSGERCTTPILQPAALYRVPPTPPHSPREHIIIEGENVSQPSPLSRKPDHELTVKMESLRNTTSELVCVNCSMQIIPRSRALYPSQLNASGPGNDSSSHAFCSFQCLRAKCQGKQQQPNCAKINNSINSMMNNASNSSLSCHTASSSEATNGLSSILSPSDHSFLDVPVIIQNYTPMGRIIKSAKKFTEANSNQNPNKSRRRSGGDDSGTFRKWAGTRWLRHTPNGLLNHLRGISNKKNSIKSEINSPSNDTGLFNSSVLRKSSQEGDARVCKLCGGHGDGDEQLLGRLLNYDSDVWIHLNCALWCFETYETVSGSLMDVQNSVERALETKCSKCEKLGAGLPCFFVNCNKVYHVKCAKESNCSFYTDRGMFCEAHSSAENSKFLLDFLSVPRKVYIERDEDNLVEKILQNDESKRLRIGSFILDSIGQLLPEQLSSGHFNDKDFIYPIGYSACRFFWSTTTINKRSVYKCRIEETPQECRLCEKHSGSCKYSFSPKFLVDEFDENGNLLKSHSGLSTRQAWDPILRQIEKLRLESPGKPLKFFSRHCNPDFLFGFHESHVIRALESLPGIEYLCGYQFKFGRTQLISEMPLAINPSGCARSEPKLSTYVKRRNSQLPVHFNIASHTPTHSASVNYQSNSDMSPTSRSLVQSKSLQYRKLKSEWKSNVTLSRSRIQGFGLYAARDIERGSFIIEYLGETIRNEVANRRERLYESQNRGVYMFRADDDKIVDATMSGGLARYINHSCSPNCIAEVVIFDGGSHIVIIANRKIERGEELTYDYKFDFEEDKPNERIPCLCGSRNCRKWMN